MSNISYPNKKIILRGRFNSVSFGHVKDQILTAAWINNRINLFYKLTLQSYKAQTNQNFEVYYDYSPNSEITPMQALAPFPDLPSNVHFDTTDNNDHAILEIAKNCDILYITRTESDDLFHRKFVQRLYDFNPAPTTEAIVVQDGYFYILKTHTLKNYFDPSPPFHTFIYNSEDYIQGKRYVLDPYYGHSSVIKLLKYEILPGKNYIVDVTGSNTLTRETSPFAKTFVPQEQVDQILKDFGYVI